MPPIRRSTKRKATVQANTGKHKARKTPQVQQGQASQPSTSAVTSDEMSTGAHTHSEFRADTGAVGNVTNHSKDIWILGSSIVYWAQRRAVTRPVGQHLRLQQYGGRIRWCGVRDEVTDDSCGGRTYGECHWWDRIRSPFANT
ncbi:uncharacterized protein LOC121376191 isoform X2 [Gigantopelta aegis]|uniref:uncharacterized protein LOC121376191 isoform X2 n=1 Tax=Gigantopelta aegis TaxID=1735272 RepID=UPI001B88C60D|nr:uncharacterized protein LOC121376191 isoform X2 [Gigantopelta aegis]